MLVIQLWPLEAANSHTGPLTPTLENEQQIDSPEYIEVSFAHFYPLVFMFSFPPLIRVFTFTSALQEKYKEVKARNSQLLKMLQQGESELNISKII